MKASQEQSSRYKSRPFSNDELDLYFMGSFLYGETIEELAVEHQRSEIFIKDKIIDGLKKDHNKYMAEKFIEQGRKRALKKLHRKG